MTQAAEVVDPVAAAITAFTRRGYEATSVDDIADAAGISRSTFFRRYGSKEDIVFADHELLLSRVEAYLAATGDAPLEAVCSAARMVFDHHVANRDTSVPRAALLHTVPDLRDRELITSHRYERAFADYLQRTIGQSGDRAEYAVVAFTAAVVAVHNRILRQWLHQPDQQLVPTLTTQLRAVADVFRATFSQDVEPRRVLVAVFDATIRPDEVLNALQETLQPSSARTALSDTGDPNRNPSLQGPATTPRVG